VAAHAEDALGGAGVAQVLYLALAVSAAKTAGAKGLVAGEDGQVLDLVAAGVAAVRAVVTDERAVAEEEQVSVGVEEGAARVAAEAVNVPSVAGCTAVPVSSRPHQYLGGRKGGSRTELESLSLLQYLRAAWSASSHPRHSGCGVRDTPHLSAAFAWIHHILLVIGRLGIHAGGIHCQAGLFGGETEARMPGYSRRERHARARPRPPSASPDEGESGTPRLSLTLTLTLAHSHSHSHNPSNPQVRLPSPTLAPAPRSFAQALHVCRATQRDDNNGNNQSDDNNSDTGRAKMAGLGDIVIWAGGARRVVALSQRVVRSRRTAARTAVSAKGTLV